MFSLAHALPSPASAEENSSLFGWFIGSMAWSDSSETYMPALRLWAFSGRPRFGFFRGAPEVSRFSCLLFLSVRRFFDYAGPADHSRLSRSAVLPSPLRQKVGVLIHRLFEAQYPGPPMPLSTLRAPPHDVARKTRGQDGFAVLLSCRVGIELGRADVRPRVSSPALSVAEWVPSSAMATFPQAPLRSRMVGFPESGSDLGDAHKTFPMAAEFKCSVHMHSATPTVCFVGGFTLRGSV